MSKDVDIDEMKKEVDEMLRAMLGSDLMVLRWWNSPNIEFKLEKPYIVWEYDPLQVHKYVSKYILR